MPPRSRARLSVVEGGGRERFRRLFFPGVSPARWNDWHWQVRSSFQDLEGFARFLRLTGEEREALLQAGTLMKARVTPYYASLLDPLDASHPLRRCVVPVERELLRGGEEVDDPLCEEADSPVPGIVHRYPNRALFLVTDRCAGNCRYCTRSRLVGNGAAPPLSASHWHEALAYIAATPTIRDVLISGGDPLLLADETLAGLLTSLRGIPHVEVVRIGTRAPVVLPQRITAGLCRTLKRFHPLWMSIHFAHPQEITREVRTACGRLADAGIPLGSQTVLLAGVNDDLETLRRLFQGLLGLRVRPYYLYQCDPVPGTSHFRTPVGRGLELVQGLRGFLSGYAVPTYVIDAPGGGGKIPLLPDPVVKHEDGRLLLRNYQGRMFAYPDDAGEG